MYILCQVQFSGLISQVKFTGDFFDSTCSPMSLTQFNVPSISNNSSSIANYLFMKFYLPLNSLEQYCRTGTSFSSLLLAVLLPFLLLLLFLLPLPFPLLPSPLSPFPSSSPPQLSIANIQQLDFINDLTT